jgi:outer membrane protein assembly factor BamA
VPFVAVAICLATATAFADEIKEIQVDENTKTTDDTVALICRIEVGDEWSADMAETCRLRLISSGLFRDDPTVFSEPHKSGSGVKITIVVRDKHSWVIAPAFYTQPTNFGGGVGFGENNLFGKNQKLLLYGQIATQDTFFIGAWVIPNLGGTRWYAQIDTFLKSQRNFEYNVPRTYINLASDINEPGNANKAVRDSRLNYLNGGLKLGIELFRGFRIDGRLRAANVWFTDVKLAEGASIEDVTGDPNSDPAAVPEPGAQGRDVSTEFTISIDRRANYYGVATGYRYVASYETAQEGLGSDFRYSMVGLGFYKAERVLERHNVVLRGRVDYGHQLPFQQEFLAGGTSMRGWLNNQFRGDFRATANLEYSVPFFTIKGLSIRGLAFLDSAYTTFLTTSNPDRNYLPYSRRDGRDRAKGLPDLDAGLDGRSKFQEYLAPFKNSIGIGTRFYMRQIVLPLLGLDFGYGLEANDFQVYLAIGLTD